MSEALTANFGESDFHAAFVADYSAVLHALVLAAETLPVSYGTEDARAEKPVALRLESSIVDGFRLRDLTMRPAPDLFRRCKADPNAVEVGDVIAEVKRARTVQSVLRFACRPDPLIGAS